MLLKESSLRLINAIGRMVNFNEKTLFHCKIIIFFADIIGLTKYYWINDLNILFWKNEGRNIT